MARVHFVKAARKDNPAVKKGEPYYWWRLYHGPKQYSKTRPRMSQLTGSDKLSRLYAAREMVEDRIDKLNGGEPVNTAEFIEALVDDLESAANEAREVGEEYEDSASNMEDYFPDSEKVEECREKSEACESWADMLDATVEEIRESAEEMEIEDVVSLVEEAIGGLDL